MNNYELYHYGIPGMKWGVRKADDRPRIERRAERDAKKLANLAAKEYSKTKAFTGRLNVAAGLNATGDRRVQKVLRDGERTVSSAATKTAKLKAKLAARYKDTPYADITVDTRQLENGRAYCAVLMGSAGKSGYDGTDLYRVTAGTWAK